MRKLHSVLLVVAASLVASTVLRPKSACACSDSSASCISNLKQIESAKEQWATDHPETSGKRPPAMKDLTGPGKYLKAMPSCPSHGRYLINSLGRNPECIGAEADTRHAIPN